jgi:hypothetical protein
MNNIFVGNLNYSTTQEDLHAAFAQFGNVERVNVVTDRDSGQPRGFAFVEMTDAKDRAERDFAIERRGAARSCDERERSSSEADWRRWTRRL